MASSKKNVCPRCGNLKTAWSSMCQTCWGEHERLQSAADRRQADIDFLTVYDGKSLAYIARQLDVSRARAAVLRTKAQRRLATNLPQQALAM